MNWFYVFTGKFGKIEFVKAILPFSFNQYWYFTSYTVTCLFMPFIDRFLEKASEKKIKKLFPVLVIFVMYVAIDRRWSDPFLVVRGYSYTWLTILYFVGACIRKFEIYKKVKVSKAVMTYIVLLGVTYFWYVAAVNIPHVPEDLFYLYTSPTMFGIAIVLVLLFARLKVPAQPIRNIAGASFAVYLFHDSIGFRYNFVKEYLGFVADLNPLLILPVCIGIALCFYAAGYVLEMIRRFIFRIVHIDRLIRRISDTVTEKIKRYFEV